MLSKRDFYYLKRFKVLSDKIVFCDVKGRVIFSFPRIDGLDDEKWLALVKFCALSIDENIFAGFDGDSVLAPFLVTEKHFLRHVKDGLSFFGAEKDSEIKDSLDFYASCGVDVTGFADYAYQKLK